MPEDLRGRCPEAPVDFHDTASLREAVPPGSVIIHAVGTTRDSADTSLWETNYGITRNLLEGARNPSGIVFFSGIGTSQTAWDPYFQSKWRAEELVRQSGVSHVIFRLSYIIGHGDEIVTPLLTSFSEGLAFEIIGDGHYRLQPILIDDVCAATVSALALARSGRVTLDLPGPETVSLLELVRLVGEVSGHTPRLGHVSLDAALRRALKGGLPGTAEIIVMMCDEVSDSRDAYRVLGIRPTPLRTAVETCVRLHRLASADGLPA